MPVKKTRKQNLEESKKRKDLRDKQAEAQGQKFFFDGKEQTRSQYEASKRSLPGSTGIGSDNVAGLGREEMAKRAEDRAIIEQREIETAKKIETPTANYPINEFSGQATARDLENAGITPFNPNENIGGETLANQPLPYQIAAGIATSGIPLGAPAAIGAEVTTATQAAGKISYVQKVLKNKRAQEELHRVYTANKLANMMKISVPQAERLVTATFKPNNGINLVNLAKKTAKVAKWAFIGGFALQVQQFWASVDNVAGLASMDALALSNAATFTDISNEDIELEKIRINAEMQFARNAIPVAQMYNPITGYFIGKFYKKVVELTQGSIDSRFRNIDRIRP